MPVNLPGFLFGEAPMACNTTGDSCARAANISIASGWNEESTQRSHRQGERQSNIKV